MNLLEIILLVLTVWMALTGARKGFVKKLASMVSLVLSIVLVSATLPYMTQFLRENTPIYAGIVSQCETLMDKKIGQLTGGSDQADSEIINSMGRPEQMELIENLPLPGNLKDMLLDYNNEEGYKSLAVSNFRDYISHFIANVVLNVLSFLAAVIMVQLFLWAVITALNLLANLPVISIVNRLAGLLLGLIQALVLIWAFFLILSMFSATDTGMYLMSMVQQSRYLRELYEVNPFLYVVMRTTALFV